MLFVPSLILLVLSLLPGCTPELDARARFEAEVVPVLQARCLNSACHGVEAGAEPELTIDWTRMVVQLDAQGEITDLDAAYETVRRYVVTNEDPKFSSLLTRPLPAEFGGTQHYGGACFTSPEDPDWVAMRDWVATESEGGEEQPELNDREQLFADTVQPHLVARGCMTGNCHGLSAALPYRFDGGVQGEFSRASTRANYSSALSMVSLDGDATQSRLIRKGLNLFAGGIIHKGGNQAFFTGLGDEAVDAVEAWACEERRARLGVPCEAASDGFVYVRGPVEAEDPFDLDAFVPGSDIWWSRADGSRENLTESLHLGAADVREPAVDPTGTRLAFVMREEGDAGHHAWVMDLNTRVATQVTTGDVGADRDPTWSPDGKLWFTSSRAGILADDGVRLDAELYELNLSSGEVTRRTWTPHIERKPVFFVIGTENGGEVGFTALREAIRSKQRAHIFRFPPDLETEYHPHFGISAPENMFYDMRELPDGRFSVILSEVNNVWEGGRLAIVERNFGPEIPAGGEDSASIPFYADPIARLDDEAAASGVSGSLYRDPSAEPDGRVLVARAIGPIDLGDPEATPVFRIERLTLAESVSGEGPSISGREVVLEEAGMSVYDPEPVYVRRGAPLVAEPSWDPAETTGVVRVIGLGTIASLLLDLPPTGAKPVAYGVVGVRLVEALPLTPAERVAVPEADLRDGASNATSTGIGPFPPARVLAELPIAADGSLYGELPAGVSFRLQPLDSSGRAIDIDYNRWYYVAPGQVLTQGVSATDDHYYTFACAVCHGSMSGVPEDVFVEPDIMTTASISLAQYVNKDPRRPIAPPQAGDATRVEADWRRDILPILTGGCAWGGCHSAQDRAAGLSLTAEATTWFDDAYESLLGGYVVPGSSYQSHLTEVLTGEELTASAALAAPGTPHGGLTTEEILAITRWIDLGATWRGTP
ncbi:hypothetical protein LBMAG42_10990 [Deltaproteobacteria bacterium]|nr:hypothetical protein LBMAG42_10990 [Deltaproteobacteria bacterium]